MIARPKSLEVIAAASLSDPGAGRETTSEVSPPRAGTFRAGRAVEIERG
jgi:hypothetical protein